MMYRFSLLVFTAFFCALLASCTWFKEDAVAYYHRGVDYITLGYYGYAIDAFENAIRIDPSYAEAHVKLGIVYSRIGKDVISIEHLTRAIMIKPNSAEAHYNLGLVYSSLGRRREATDSFRKAISLVPNDPLPHFGLGILYTQEKDSISALAEYSILKTLDTTKAATLRSLIHP